jgi:hypothetical protein
MLGHAVESGFCQSLDMERDGKVYDLGSLLFRC